MGHKAAGTTRSSNNAFGPGAANELTVLWWFKKFCKGDKSLEDEQHSAGHPKLTMTKLSAITEADPLTATLEVAEELNVTRSVTVFWCLEQSRKVEKPNEQVPREPTADQRSHCFEGLLLFSAATSNHFLWFLMRNDKWVLYNNQ